MHVNLHKVWVYCKHCVEGLSATEVKALMCRAGSGLKDICQKLNWMAQFLRCGRLGFELTHWPDKFFDYAVLLLTEVISMVLCLAQTPHCLALEQEAVAPAQYVQRRLIEIHKERIDIGKRMRETQGTNHTVVAEEEKQRRHGVEFTGTGLRSVDDKESLMSFWAGSNLDGRKDLALNPTAKKVNGETEVVSLKGVGTNIYRVE